MFWILCLHSESFGYDLSIHLEYCLELKTFIWKICNFKHLCGIFAVLSIHLEYLQF